MRFQPHVVRLGDEDYSVSITGPKIADGHRGWARFTLHFVRVRRRDRIAGRLIALVLFARIVREALR